jgi:hypothetical protein
MQGALKHNLGAHLQRFSATANPTDWGFLIALPNQNKEAAPNLSDSER